MRSLRPFAWVIIAVNIYFFYTFFKGVIELEQDNLAIGFFSILLLFVWAVVNIILYVIYRVTNKNKARVCPACADKVKVGLTVCSKCGFDFMKMALGVDGSDKVDKLVNVNSDNSKQSNLVGASGKIGWKSTLTVLVIAVILIGIISSQSGSQDDWNSKKEEISSNIQESTAEDSWIPTGYSLWSKNPPIAIKVLSPNSYDCGYYDRCFGIMIISKDGCPNNLYGEVQLLNKSGVQIGYTNEVLSSSLPLQKSKMIFGTYERDTYQFQVSKISCY